MDYEESHSLSLDPGAGAADGLQHKVPSPAQQADEIETAEAKDISEGEQMYLVSEGCVCGWSGGAVLGLGLLATGWEGMW
jgi:hypothetical protein